jgi:hypothetical protein
VREFQPIPLEELENEFPGREVRLWLDLGGAMLWCREGAGTEFPGIFPIDDALVVDLKRWARDYLEWSGETGETIHPEARFDFPRAEFDRRGISLTGRLQAQMGSDWTISYLALPDLTRSDRS